MKLTDDQKDKKEDADKFIEEIIGMMNDKGLSGTQSVYTANTLLMTIIRSFSEEMRPSILDFSMKMLKEGIESEI